MSGRSMAMALREAIVETPRLRLTGWTPDDLEDAHRLWGDPRVMRYVGPPHEDRTRTRDALAAAVESQRSDGVSLWRAEEREGGFVGCCGFQVFDGPGSRRAGTRWLELGYHLVPERWGRGYAVEAARACLAWSVRYGVTHVVAFTAPEHERSARVLARLGFVSNGLEGEALRHVWSPPNGVQEFSSNTGASKG